MRVALPDGKVVEFPDGTPIPVMEKALADYTRNTNRQVAMREAAGGQAPATFGAGDAASTAGPEDTRPSVSGARDLLRTLDSAAVNALAPGADAGPVEKTMRRAAAMVPHTAAFVAEQPLNALLGLGQGVGALTLNPEGTYGLTPEGNAAVGGAGNPLRFGPRTSPAGVPLGTLNREAPLSPEFRAAPGGPPERPPMAPPPGGPDGPFFPDVRPPPPGPGMTTGVPTMTVRPGSVTMEGQPGQGGSVGAAATREGTPLDEFQLTPQQIEGYRATAEGSKLVEPLDLTVPDYREYVRGVRPTPVEAEPLSSRAREAKALRAGNTAVGDVEQATGKLHNEAYLNHFDETTGSPVTVRAEKDARDTWGATQRERLWANQKEVDATPVERVGREIMGGPEGREADVRGPVNAALKELYDDDGNLISNPRMLYGVRRNINNLIEKRDLTGARVNSLAVKELIALRDALDNVIEGGAPGFRKYLSDYAEASRRIDEMEVLQAFRNGLVDVGNTMQYGRVQKMMRDIIDARNLPGAVPEKAIRQETMDRLWDLRDSMRRSYEARKAGAAPGSDTAQTMMDMVRTSVIPSAVGTGVGMLLSPIVGPWAGVGAGTAVGGVARSLAQRKIERRNLQRGTELYSPAPQNPLMGPP